MVSQRPPRLDPEALKTFLVVAETRSFSAAADILHKTTAAISYRIRALEESVGTRLFTRTTRTVSLTPAGQLLQERARQIFDWLQTLPEELQQMNAGVEQNFTIVVNNLLYNSDGVATLLNYLYQRFPHTKFAVYRSVYMGVWDTLVNRNGQFAIGSPGWHAVHEDLETMPIGQINWRLVMHPNHPLTKESEPLSDGALRSYPAVNVEDTSESFRKRTAWNLVGQQEIRVPSQTTKIACHCKGLGIGFLPAKLAEKYIREGTLVSREPQYGRNPSPMSLSWRKTTAGNITSHLCHLFKTRDPLVRCFLANVNPLPTDTLNREG